MNYLAAYKLFWFEVKIYDASAMAADLLAPVAETVDRKPSFFACYLLCSQKPRCGRTYIGFTVNPRRRIRQHNGEITSGAFRTKKWRPWEMILCLYGFPSQVHALQFEWAWQHPQKSLAVKEAISGLKALGGKQGKVMVMYKMLNAPKWNNLDLTINFLSTKHLYLTKKCPCLPPQMQVKVGPLEDLPCYLDLDDSDSDNNDNVNDGGGDNDDGSDEDGNNNTDEEEEEIEAVNKDEIEVVNKESEDGVPCMTAAVTSNVEPLLQRRQEPPGMDHEDYREAMGRSLTDDISHSLPLKSSFSCGNPVEIVDTHFNHHDSIDMVEESPLSSSKLESKDADKVLINLVSPESHQGKMRLHRCNIESHLSDILSHQFNRESHRQHEIESQQHHEVGSQEQEMRCRWKPKNGGDDIGADLSFNTPIAHHRNEETRSNLDNISEFSPLWSPSPCQKPGGAIDLSECFPTNIFSTPKLDSSTSRPQFGVVLGLQGKPREIIDLTSSPIVP